MAVEPTVSLFLSSGRCGTQWLAAVLARMYSDVAVVTHEPIGPMYQPKRVFRASDAAERMLGIDAVRDHIASIERIAETKSYIETGWPSCAAIPLFRRRFGDRFRLVQLVRDPVPTAMSLVTHGFFDGRDDEWATEALLDPTSPNVAQTEYAERWAALSPYEKCLFVWTEIHLYGEALRELSFPMMTIRTEDILLPTGALQSLITFLGLPDRPVPEDATEERVDAHRFQTPDAIEWRKIFDHPRTVALATAHGYAWDGIDEGALADRYRGPLPDWRLSP
jgi:hypothetical protein